MLSYFTLAGSEPVQHEYTFTRTVQSWLPSARVEQVRFKNLARSQYSVLHTGLPIQNETNPGEEYCVVDRCTISSSVLYIYLGGILCSS